MPACRVRRWRDYRVGQHRGGQIFIAAQVGGFMGGAVWVVRRDTAIDKLVQQLNRTIEWSACMDMLYERGCRSFLELGPGCVLARMAQARFADVDGDRAIDDFRSPDGVSAWLSRHTVRG